MFGVTRKGNPAIGSYENDRCVRPCPLDLTAS
jgi:hypothetical protein